MQLPCELTWPLQQPWGHTAQGSQKTLPITLLFCSDLLAATRPLTGLC